MNTKHNYEAPEAELLVVKFEERFLNGSPTNESFNSKGFGGVFEEEE